MSEQNIADISARLAGVVDAIDRIDPFQKSPVMQHARDSALATIALYSNQPALNPLDHEQTK